MHFPKRIEANVHLLLNKIYLKTGNSTSDEFQRFHVWYSKYSVRACKRSDAREVDHLLSSTRLRFFSDHFCTSKFGVHAVLPFKAWVEF
jgi:hypothetical protein